MRSIFILAIALLFTQAIEQSTFTHTPGRSGDILLRQKDFEDNSFVYLLSRDASEINSIEDQSFADLISHSVGGPVINTEANKASFPKGSVFDKSAGNLMFVVDSVDSEYLAQFQGLTMFNTQYNGLTGKTVQLGRTSYPQDTIATLATLASGTSPSVHGITGASWATQSGEITAFKAGAYPYIQNVADAFSQTYKGRSLIFSGSSNFQMTSALAVNQFVHLPFNNEIAMYFNPNRAKFDNIYTNSFDSSSLQFTYKELFEALGPRKVNYPTFAIQDPTVTYSVEENTVTVELISKNLSSVFNLGINDVALFFAEIQYVKNVMLSLVTDPALSALTKDKVPDLFSFAFASLKGVQTRYGKDSAQAKIAVYLLDQTIVEAINSLSTIYSEKVTVEIVFLGTSAVDALRMNKAAKKSVLELVGKKVNSDNFDNNFPSIYLEDIKYLDGVCELLKAATTFEVYCTEPTYFHHFPILEVNGTNSTNTTNGTIPTKDAAIFQISLWFPIILGLTLLAVIIAMCTMDIGADSMIYRSTNIRHAHIS